MDKAIAEASRVLRTHGMPEVADRAKLVMAAPSRKPTLVVIGEVKRGKSSLVNALLGKRDASPVGVDIATSAFIRFVPGSDAHGEGETTLLFAGGRQRRIDCRDLPNWVTAEGTQVLDDQVDELPIGAEVVMDSAFLPNVAIVDTPGVGGLNPAHIRLTTDAATRASALLMVCDSTTPITNVEIEFLQSVSAEVESVVIAVTKTDKNLRHWRAIVDENRRLLQEHAPRFSHVPIVGVSSARATAAFETEAGERRDTALRHSGVPDLADHLRRVCDEEDRLVRVNAMRMLRTGLDRLGDQLALQQSANQGGDELIQGLAAEKQRLQKLQEEEKSGWRDFLGSDLTSLLYATTRLLDEKLDELKTKWRNRIDTTKWEAIRRSPQLLIAEVTADLEVLVAEISDDYIASVTTLVRTLGADIELSLDKLNSIRVPDDKPRRAGVLDPQVLTLGVIGSNTLGHGVLAAMGIGAAAAVAWPVSLALGGAWIAVNLGFRAVKAGRQNLQQWLNTTVGAVRNDVVRELQERTNTIRPIIFDEYRRYLALSIEQLQALIKDANLAARRTRSEREDAVAEIQAIEAGRLQALAAIDRQLSRYASPAN
ncbi:MAG: dynamin family protein [Mycobacterium sp.]